MHHWPRLFLSLGLCCLLSLLTLAASAQTLMQNNPLTPAATSPLAPHLHWSAGQPIAGPVDGEGDHYYAIKDPSFVQFGGRWHMFCTVRGKNRPQQIEYLTFTDWNAIDKGERHMLPITDDYFCAPTVFYFTPQHKWYLIYQYAPGSRTDSHRIAGFSTNDDIANWQGWSKPQPLYDVDSPTSKTFAGLWIDFWTICDEHNAYLFYTCDNGDMWRAQTSLAAFPQGWSDPVRIMHGDIFEASCTYRVAGTGQYLTIIEAIHHDPARPFRYFKSYVADTLDGAWTPLADTWDKPFAALTNLSQPGGYWTDNVSHGELLRTGYDEKMEVPARDIKFVIQGVSAFNLAKPYGEIPWRLAIITPEVLPTK